MLISKYLTHLLLEFTPGDAKLGNIHLRSTLQFRLYKVVSQIAHQHTPGGEMCRRGRNNNAWYAHISCQRGGMHRATSTKGHNSKVARITSLSHRNQFEQVDHISIGYADDAQGRFLNADPQRTCYGCHCFARTRNVEANAATQEIHWVDAPDDNIGISHCGFASSMPVGSRARFGTCAAGSDFERASWVDPGD